MSKLWMARRIGRRGGLWMLRRFDGGYEGAFVAFVF
jgi:hypothetical protein